jgi:hypothetical protein
MALRMVAYQLAEYNEPFRRVVQPVPVPTGTQVLLAVEVC